MQHLEDDMDDLFQRAAEGYPLKDSADWESVARKLEAAGNPGKAVVPTKDKKDKKIIFFLLLLFLLSGALFTWHSFSSKNSPADKNIELAKENKAIQANSNSRNNVEIISADKPVQDFSSLKNKTKKNKNIVSSQTKVTTSASNPSFVFSNKTFDKTKLKSNTGKESNDDNGNVSDSKNLKESSGNNSPEKTKNSTEVIPSQPSKEDNKLKKQEEKKSSPDTAKSGKKIVAKANTKNNGLYAGLITGLDFSKVESGSFGNTGFDAGLIIGYTFHQRLSVETGLFVNNKNYNSAGKDFNMDKIGPTMPSGMVINNINSHSSLLEIPVKVKYNFIVKPTSAFFIAGGASAYIMTKEKNMYDATVNGADEKIMGIYNKINYGLPAVANISVGYEHKISGMLNVRFEPFLKIPLRGMGVGSLPVTSAGLQIGITGHLK